MSSNVNRDPGEVKTAKKKESCVTVTADDIHKISKILGKSPLAFINYQQFFVELGLTFQIGPRILTDGQSDYCDQYRNSLYEWQAKVCKKDRTLQAIIRALEALEWNVVKEEMQELLVHHHSTEDISEEEVITLGEGLEHFCDTLQSNETEPRDRWNMAVSVHNSSPSQVATTWWPVEKVPLECLAERGSDGLRHLEMLHSLLNETSRRVVITPEASNHILGGVGKSTLAMWYAQTYADLFSHIIWVDCGQDSLKASIARFQNKPEQNLNPREVKQCFMALQGRPSLLIYHNAESYGGVAGIEDVLPCATTFPKIWCLITSNLCLWDSSGNATPIPPFELEPFSKDESVFFLQKNLRQVKGERKELLRLADMLGFYPLALQIALVHLNNHYSYQQVGVTAYMGVLLEHLQQAATRSSTASEESTRILRPVLTETISRLKDSPSGGLAWKMLCQLTFLKPNYVGVRFVSCVEGVPYSSALEACHALARHSLVTLTSLPEPSSDIFPHDTHYISIHRNLQTCLKVIIGPESINHYSRILRSRPTKVEDAIYKLEPYLSFKGSFTDYHEADNVKDDISTAIELVPYLKSYTLAGYLTPLHYHLKTELCLSNGIGRPVGSASLQMDSRQYNLKELLGCGRFGIVFSAEGAAGPVVIKYLRDSDTKSHNRILQEYCTLTLHENRQLNLIKILGLWNVDCSCLDVHVNQLVGDPLLSEEHGDNPHLYHHMRIMAKSTGPIRCIEMELCGPSLRYWLYDPDGSHEAAFSTDDRMKLALDIGNDIIRGVKFLHGRNIWHRNLKPENIYFSVTPKGFSCPIKIGDSGQSPSDSKTLQKVQTTVTTYDLYKATEVEMVTTAEYRYEADWFSVGLMLYKLIYQIPHKDLRTDFGGLVDYRIMKPHPLPTGIYVNRKKVIEEIILGLSEKEPYERRETISRLEKIADFQQFLAAQTASETDTDGALETGSYTGSSYRRKYQLQEYLGCGGFGIVFAVKSSKPHLAVKMFASSGDCMQENMLRTCELMSCCDNQHPNLVKMFGHTIVDNASAVYQMQKVNWKKSDDPYQFFHLAKLEIPNVHIRCIEMELCGPNLRSWLSVPVKIEVDETDSEELYQTAIDIASGIINGLKFLHSREVVHGNMKPENMYFSSHSTSCKGWCLPIKIGDLDQFCNINQEEEYEQRVYSKLYAANEIRYKASSSTQNRHTENSDWFSMGLILYEIFYLNPSVKLECAFRELKYQRKTSYSGRFNSENIMQKLVPIGNVILGLTLLDPACRNKMVSLLSHLYHVDEYLLYGYNFKTFLGFGSYGVVFSAETTSGDTVAVRVHPSGAEYTPNPLKNGMEILLDSVNHHLNLVNVLKQTVIAMGKNNGHQILTLLQEAKETIDDPYFYYYVAKIRNTNSIVRYIEMEFCGPSLATWLSQSEEEFCVASHLDMATNIAADVIRGLRFLHYLNVPHRKVKPQNIFFSANSSSVKFSRPIKLGDFAQCNGQDSSRGRTQTTGLFSHLYRAPESTDPTIDVGRMKLADWYSVGLILYEMFYFIGRSERERAFDWLVNEAGFERRPWIVGTDEMRITTIEPIVLGLTRRTASQRIEVVNLLSRLVRVKSKSSFKFQKYLMTGANRSRDTFRKRLPTRTSNCLVS